MRTMDATLDGAQVGYCACLGPDMMVVLLGPSREEPVGRPADLSHSLAMARRGNLADQRRVRTPALVLAAEGRAG